MQGTKRGSREPVAASQAGARSQEVPAQAACLGPDPALQRLPQVLRLFCDAILAVDEGQRIVCFDEGAERLFGYRRDEILGDLLDRLVPPALIPRHRELVGRFFAGDDEVVRMGARVVLARRKDLSEIPVEIVLGRALNSGNDGPHQIVYAYLRDASLQEPGGQPGGDPHLVGDLRGATVALAIAHESLAHAQRWLQHLLDAAPTILYALAPGGDFPVTFIGDNVARILGHPARDFVLSPDFWLRHIHPEDKERICAAFGTVLRQHRHAIDYRFQHRDGGWRWIRDDMRLLLDTAGVPKEIVGAMSDITAQKEAELALKQAHNELEERVRARTLELSQAIASLETEVVERLKAEAGLRLAATVFEGSSEAIVVTDPEERILSVNGAFTEITGYPAAAVLGRTPRILSSGRHGKDFYQAMWRAILEEGRWRGEVWDRRQSGEVYPKWLAISAVRGPTGEISHFVGIFSDITQRKAAEEEIQYLAHHDALTGLPNRSLLRGRLAQALNSAARAGDRVAVLFVDLDRFKHINDSLGHLVGDRLLMEVANRLAALIRESDTVSRQGGDEFVVVLAAVRDLDAVRRLAARILEEIAAPFLIDGHSLAISASVGIALYPDDDEDLDGLLRKADLALYVSKEEGRDTFRFFTGAMNDAVHQRHALEQDLRLALQRGEFVLYFQPKWDLPSGQILGAEALLRWRHPERGLLAAAEFIDVAEDCGINLPLGEWVLEEACRQAAMWRAAGHLNLGMAVNLSPSQFRAEALTALVTAALARHALPPAALELELAEALLFQDLERTRVQLARLKALGIGIAVDEFAASYANLAQLQAFAVDKVKISRAFVAGLAGGPSEQAIVHAVLELARGLRIASVVEGVETEAQASYLRQEDCHEVQGFYFARPLPAAEFAALLAAAPP